MSQHQTLNSDASGVTPDASGVASDANSGTLYDNSFHQTLYTGLKHRESCKLSLHWTLTLNTSDLIPDASVLISDASDLTSDVFGLYALHKTIFNFFPCFHVPTPKCHNTCASVLAFSQTSLPLLIVRPSILNPVINFSTHLRPVKEKALGYNFTFCFPFQLLQC